MDMGLFKEELAGGLVGWMRDYTGAGERRRDADGGRGSTPNGGQLAAAPGKR